MPLNHKNNIFSFQSHQNYEDFEVFSLDDVDAAFDRIIQLKYSQNVSLKGKFGNSYSRSVVYTLVVNEQTMKAIAYILFYVVLAWLLFGRQYYWIFSVLVDTNYPEMKYFCSMGIVETGAVSVVVQYG